ncbi:MAG: Nitrilase/cyanide hydratase and apolipoprotein N-acyltransferase, partial [uncultured Gemmatimonadaceae bacterium]
DRPRGRAARHRRRRAGGGRPRPGRRARAHGGGGARGPRGRGGARGLPRDLDPGLPRLARPLPRRRALGPRAGQGGVRADGARQRGSARARLRRTRRAGPRRPDDAGRGRDRAGGARGGARHAVQQPAHHRARRAPAQPPPEARPHLHRAAGVGARGRGGAAGRGHPSRPGRRVGVLGALDAARPAGATRVGRGHPRGRVAHRARDAPGGEPAVRLRGALLRARRRRADARLGASARARGAPGARDRPRAVGAARRQRDRGPRRPLRGGARLRRAAALAHYWVTGDRRRMARPRLEL